MSNELMTVRNFLTTTKAEIADFAESAIAKVTDGEMEASRLARFAKTLEEMAKRILTDERVKNALYEEITSYEGDRVTLHNAEWQVKAVGVKYDYSVCGDPEWDRLNAEIERLTEERKKVEKHLQGISKPMCDPDTGAMIYPPAKSGSEQVVITLKK